MTPVMTVNITETYWRPPTVIGAPLRGLFFLFLGGRATKPRVLLKGDKVLVIYLLVRRQSPIFTNLVVQK